MKKFFVILSILLFSSALALNITDCYKLFPKDADTVFMSAISVLNSNSKFKIDEIQTKNGYILFLYGSKYYLMTITKRYQNQTEVKILPQNSNFTADNPAIIIFPLIQAKLNRPMELVK